MGSGPIILAAERSGRVAYGVEMDGAYVDVAIRRWEKMTGKTARLLETRESFAEVPAHRSSATQPAEDPATVPIFRHRQQSLAA